MTIIFTFVHTGDLYEVGLDGHIITRISRYWNGSSHRQDIEFDDCPEEVKDKILIKVGEALTQ